MAFSYSILTRSLSLAALFVVPFCGTQILAASGQPAANTPIRVAWLNYQQIDPATFDELESYLQDELEREVTIDRFT